MPSIYELDYAKEYEARGIPFCPKCKGNSVEINTRPFFKESCVSFEIKCSCGNKYIIVFKFTGYINK
jgi:hypothetical protein